MAKWKPGDRVKVVERKATKEDMQTNSYYSHFANLTGTVTNFYNKDEVAVKIDSETFPPTLAEVHKEAVKRMRAKFLDSLSEEQRRKLSKEERSFEANYVLLLHSDDLIKGPPAPKPQKPKAQDEDGEDLEDFDPTSIKQGVLYDDAEIPSGADRKTLAQIEAQEEAELKRRRN